MAFFITLLVLAGIGWVLRACFPQQPPQQWQNHAPRWQQPIQQRGPSYLGTGLAVAGGMVAADLITDQFTGDAAAAVPDAPIEHDVAAVEPDMQIEPDLEAPEVDTSEWDFGSFF